MANFWQEENLIKQDDYGIRWYRIGKIQIVSSEGDMRRVAIDVWQKMVKEAIDSAHPDESLFIIVDLSAPKQGFTPYSSGVTRNLLTHLQQNRKGMSYIGLVLASNLLMQLVSTFFQQLLSLTRYPRRTFTEPQSALNWIQEQIIMDEKKNSQK